MAVPGQPLPSADEVRDNPRAIDSSDVWIFDDEDYKFKKTDVLPGDTAAKLVDILRSLSQKGLRLKYPPDRNTKFMAALNQDEWLIKVDQFTVLGGQATSVSGIISLRYLI